MIVGLYLMYSVKYLFCSFGKTGENLPICAGAPILFRNRRISAGAIRFLSVPMSKIDSGNVFVPGQPVPVTYRPRKFCLCRYGEPYCAQKDSRGGADEVIDMIPSTRDGGSYSVPNGKAVKGSGTTARGRRLLKVQEEKQKRDYAQLHNYPAWAKVLEDACKNDSELRAVLGDSIGNPELMRKRVEDRVQKKGRDFQKSKSGSVLAFKVSFRDFNPLGSYIWFELYGVPSDRDVDLLGSVMQSWYVMGRLGAFNSANLQLANSSMEYDPLYDADKGSKVMPSSFHDIGDVEFQDNWGRVWVDLGTADFFAIDVLLNCLTVLSSEYLGIQQVVFGGRQMGDWEDGMKNPDDGYKSFKI